MSDWFPANKNMSRTVNIFVVALLASMFLSACARPDNDEMVRIGPDVRASMVIYYKAGVNEDQINDFLQNVLGRPHPEGRGHYLRDGIVMSLRVYPAVEGHEATAITFSDRATQAQRDEIKRDVVSNPIVYKVLENEIPAEVKKLN
jgi:hypothetical protein